MPNSGNFDIDIDRDIAVVNAGGFFCKACLTGKVASEVSPDPRYCQGCNDFLLYEAELLPDSKRPAWIPKTKATAPKDREKAIPVHQHTVLNMSTVNGKHITVDIIHPPFAKTISKRGPKQKRLPLDLIKQLAGEGMGSKAIAGKLKESGIEVSYKTIQRLLQKRMELVA